MDFISILSIFVMACFVGYYVVWSVTPALHTPLMAVTNAISSVIIVGALIAAAAPAVVSMTFNDGAPVTVDGRPTTLTAVADDAEGGWSAAKILGLIAVTLASVNIFGGFAVTERMLAMYKKKDK